MQKLKIYFAGSIRGGRDDIALYKKIINYLESIGEVLTEHIGDDEITLEGETTLTNKQIYTRDLNWLSTADVVVAEVTNPSLGVGFEIAKAIDMNKKVLCLFRLQSDKKLSAMISGCSDVQVEKYQTPEDAGKIIEDFFKLNSLAI